MSLGIVATELRDAEEGEAAAQGFTLEEIAAQEGFLLFDGCVKHDFEFLTLTYNTRSYKQLDIALLGRLLHADREMLQFLWLECVHTIPEVVEEWRQWLQILGEKTRNYNQREQFYIVDHPEKQGRGTEQKRLMAELNEQALQMVKLARKSVYTPTMPKAYEAMQRAIETMEDWLHLKTKISPYPKEREPRMWRREWPEHHADERLVAMALYLSLVENRSVALVTGDWDIVKLMRTAHCLLATRDSLPFSSEVMQTLDAHPVRLYFADPRVAEDRSRYTVPFDARERPAYSVFHKFPYSKEKVCKRAFEDSFSPHLRLMREEIA